MKRTGPSEGVALLLCLFLSPLLAVSAQGEPELLSLVSFLLRFSW